MKALDEGGRSRAEVGPDPSGVHMTKDVPEGARRVNFLKGLSQAELVAFVDGVLDEHRAANHAEGFQSDVSPL
jgi:hypothetical protein